MKSEFNVSDLDASVKTEPNEIVGSHHLDIFETNPRKIF